MPHDKKDLGKKGKEKLQNEQMLNQRALEWKNYYIEEINRQYGKRLENINCLHCAENVLTEEGYISDNELAGTAKLGKLRTPLSFEPTPRPTHEY